MKAVIVFLVCCLLAGAEARNKQIGRRQLLVDPEGASLTGISAYVKYVKANCGDPDRVAKGDCLALKQAFCGTRDTSEVLCTGGAQPFATFRSYNRYSRVEYLTCSLTKLTCSTNAQAYAPAKHALLTVDPVSLAAWYEYANKCHAPDYNPKVTSAATCANLAGEHCSRPDVKCGDAKAVQFFDLSSLKTAKKVPALKGVYADRLIFVLG